VWQTIFEAGATVGAIGAVVLAAFAFVYFKRQAAAMGESLKVTRGQMTAQQERWEIEQRREQRREHNAVRPELTFRLRARFLHPHDIEAFIDFRGGKAVRSVVASMRLEDREMVGECVPDHWPEIAVGGHANFSIRASELTQGDRLVLCISYLDDLGGAVKWHQPLVVTRSDRFLGFEPDNELSPIITDDLP
jgi:hypothetical protein